MLTQCSRTLLHLPPQCRIVPVVENRVLFRQALETKDVRAILLRHCNVFDFTAQLEKASRLGILVYVCLDHIEGVNADVAGVRFLAERLHVTGVSSSHPKVAVFGKQFGLETIQRIFVADSTGLESALSLVDPRFVDILDFSPASTIPYILTEYVDRLPLPFIGSGLIFSTAQMQAVLRAGALAVVVMRPALWV